MNVCNIYNVCDFDNVDANVYISLYNIKKEILF